MTDKSNSNKNLKQQIRKQIKEIRANQNIKSKINAEEKVCEYIKNWPIFQKAQNIGIYFSTNDELNTNKIIQEIFKLNKKCYLPVISDTENNNFDFYLYSKDFNLMPNKYNILEPEKNLNNKIDINLLDIMFIPIVAFNTYKDRLGMGGGFYDRVLSKLDLKNKTTILVGIAFDFQLVENLPNDPWDIKLDLIITDKSIY